MENLEKFKAQQSVELKKTISELVNRYSLNRSSEYDPEVFSLAFEELSKEFFEADDNQKRVILLERFLDAFYPEPDSPKTDLYENYAMRPIRLRGVESDLKDSQYVSNTTLVDPESAKHTLLENIDVLQYGPSTIYKLPPGTTISTELSDQDVIVSTDFSTCSAIAGINEEGEAFFSHITSNWKEDDLIKALKNKFGSGNLYYIHPLEKIKPGSSEEDFERRDKDQKRYKEIAEKHGLKTITYQEVNGRQSSENEHNIRGTIISLSKKGIYLIGANTETYKNSKGNSETYYKAKEETGKDISFK